MSDRVSALLNRLGLALMTAALIVPLGLGAAHLVIRRPHLQWAIVNVLEMSNNYVLYESGRYSPGFSMMFVNSGNAPTEPVRIIFARAPEHVEVLGHGDDYEVTLTGLGMDITLEPLAPGEDVVVEIYGTYGHDMDAVLEGAREVTNVPLYRTSFADPEPWLPNWTDAAGGLLLVGLALQNLALRRRRVSNQPERGENGMSVRAIREAYRS